MTLGSGWIRPGTCISATQTGPREVALRCDTAQVRLHFSAPNVVRVWCDPDGTFERKYPSFTVQDEDIAPVQVRLA